jgi:hypothetical protein
MKTHNQFVHILKDQQGVSAVIVAITLVVLIGSAALAIDIGYLYATKNELQNIADAAALAGTNEIGDQWLNGETLNVNDIKVEIQDVSSKNQAAEKHGISILDADIVIGTYDPNVPTKIGPLTGTWPTAVRVIARRTEGANAPIATIFAKMLNIHIVGVAADATAALTGESTAEPGDLEFPVGISRYWYDHDWGDGENFCNHAIKFAPTGDICGCAGWHTYDTGIGHSALAIAGLIEDLEDGVVVPPGTTAGESYFEYTGGVDASVIDELQSLFDSKKGPSIKDADGNEIPLYYDEGNCDEAIWGNDVDPTNEDHKPVEDVEGSIATQKFLYEWQTRVVVYADEEPYCDNPGGPNGGLEMVAGFSTVIVYAINDANDRPGRSILARVLCEQIGFGRPGGGNFGTAGNIAGLVE